MIYCCEKCGKKFKEAALAERCEAVHLEEEKKLETRNKEMAKDAEEVKAAHDKWRELSDKFYEKYHGVDEVHLGAPLEFFMKFWGL